MRVWQILHIWLAFTIRLHWVWVWCLNCLRCYWVHKRTKIFLFKRYTAEIWELHVLLWFWHPRLSIFCRFCPISFNLRKWQNGACCAKGIFFPAKFSFVISGYFCYFESFSDSGHFFSKPKQQGVTQWTLPRILLSGHKWHTNNFSWPSEKGLGLGLPAIWEIS